MGENFQQKFNLKSIDCRTLFKIYLKQPNLDIIKVDADYPYQF